MSAIRRLYIMQTGSLNWSRRRKNCRTGLFTTKINFLGIPLRGPPWRYFNAICLVFVASNRWYSIILFLLILTCAYILSSDWFSWPLWRQSGCNWLLWVWKWETFKRSKYHTFEGIIILSSLMWDRTLLPSFLLAF